MVDTVDADASRTAATYLAGDLTLTEALWALAALVPQSKVPRGLALSLVWSRHMNPAAIEGITAEFVDHLTGMFNPETYGARSLRIDWEQLASGASFSSWIRNWGSKGVSQSIVRDQTRRAKRFVALSDHPDEFVAGPGRRPPVREVLRTDQVLDGLMVHTRRAATDEELLHARADACTALYEIPPLVRPETAHQRERVAGALADREHVTKVLDALARRAQVDSPVMDLFADCPLGTFAGTPGHAVTLLAQAALVPRGLPRRARIRELLYWADSCHPQPPGRGQRQLLRGAVRDWLESRADLDVEASEAAGMPVHKPDERIAGEQAQFRASANACLAAGIVCCGDTVEAMTERFEEALLAVEARSVRPRTVGDVTGEVAS